MSLPHLPIQAYYELDTYEFRLFAHYVFQSMFNNNECAETLQETAERSGISTAKVAKTRNALHEKGYIDAQTYFGGATNRYRIQVNWEHFAGFTIHSPMSFHTAQTYDEAVTKAKSNAEACENAVLVFNLTGDLVHTVGSAGNNSITPTKNQ